MVSNQIHSILLTCAIGGTLACVRWPAPAAATPGDGAPPHNGAPSHEGDDSWFVTDRLETAIFSYFTKVDGAYVMSAGPGPTPECGQILETSTKDHRPATETFWIRRDIPGLKAGKYSWTAARPVCDVITKAVAIANKQNTLEYELLSAKKELENFEQGAFHLDAAFDSCLTAYDAAIQGGVSATAHMQYVSTKLEGTLQELRGKWCAEAKAKIDNAKVEAEAPYRKVLKNGKLEMWLKDTTYIDLPGRAAVTPAGLARATAWFEHLAPADEVCTNGMKLHKILRFQFNANQDLVKTTKKEYCGTPPESAWR